MRRLAKALWYLVGVAAAVAWTFTLRPQSLGGPAGYVMVRGVSMNPTYHPGDLVVTRLRHSYATGDIVAYRVPKGELGAGIVVVHRITGGSATTGYVLQGDNNAQPDDWHPKRPDVVGTAWFSVPYLGVVLAWLRAPLTLASLAAAVAVTVLLFRSKGQAGSSGGDGGEQLDDTTVEADDEDEPPRASLAKR